MTRTKKTEMKENKDRSILLKVTSQEHRKIMVSAAIAGLSLREFCRRASLIANPKEVEFWGETENKTET